MARAGHVGKADGPCYLRMVKGRYLSGLFSFYGSSCRRAKLNKSRIRARKAVSRGHAHGFSHSHVTRFKFAQFSQKTKLKNKQKKLKQGHLMTFSYFTRHITNERFKVPSKDHTRRTLSHEQDIKKTPQKTTKVSTEPFRLLTPLPHFTGCGP